MKLLTAIDCLLHSFEGTGVEENLNVPAHRASTNASAIYNKVVT